MLNLKSYLINPLKYIHPSAIAVHGLFDEDVENAPTLDKVMPKFMDDIGGSTLVAHNIDFDLDMLPELKELDNIKIDSLKLVRKIYKIGDIGYKGHALYSHKSQELRYWLNLKVDTNGLPAHRAGADIIVTKEIFEIVLREVLEKHNFQTLGELEDFINQPNLVDKINFGKFRKSSNGNYISSAEVKLMNKVRTYNIELYNNGKTLSGKQQVRFSDFGITPPKKMAGMIVVKDELDLSFIIQNN
jgi:DNA polymerase III epsilon subunit-like protein